MLQDTYIYVHQAKLLFFLAFDKLAIGNPITITLRLCDRSSDPNPGCGIMAEEPGGKTIKDAGIENAGESRLQGISSALNVIGKVSKDTLLAEIENFEELTDEFAEFCIPSKNYLFFIKIATFIRSWIHIPYFPAFHQPGWLVYYIFGPYDANYFDCLISDIWAGITVGLTLIPQGLSYASLANLPPIVGLYSAVLPSATYTFLGTALQLAVGPVALVSLLMGQLVAKYQPDYATNTTGAIDTAAQAALCVGIILTFMGLLNMGSFINFISHPVMSGFTTAAAMLIGLSQLKSAFGFGTICMTPLSTSTVTWCPVDIPQVGKDVHHNYEVMAWYVENWNGIFTYDTIGSSATLRKKYIAYIGKAFINPYAVKICFGIFIPLFTIALIKSRLKFTAVQKKTTWFRVFNATMSILPFIGIIIGGCVSYQIKKADNFNSIARTNIAPYNTHEFYAHKLSIVGKMPNGLNILRSPSLNHDFGSFFIDTIPITLIAFMESYSVARRIASQRNELNILNASQEMIANGVANLLGSISSAYPVSGSFSRSSLNHAVGARTPLGKVVCLCVVLLSLNITSVFEYIPNAALAAIIFLALWNIVCFNDYWEAWKRSKKDFIIMLLTSIIVFTFDTSTGLAVGIGASALFHLIDVVTNVRHQPTVVEYPDNKHICIIRINSDLNFLTSAAFKDFVTKLTIPVNRPPVHIDNLESRPWYDVDRRILIKYQISKSFDSIFKPNELLGVEELPLAVIIDVGLVRSADITGFMAIEEIVLEVRSRGIKVVLIHSPKWLVREFNKYGIENDVGDDLLDLDHFLKFDSKLPRRQVKKVDAAKSGMVDSHVSEVEMADSIAKIV